MSRVQITVQHYGGAREVGATSYTIAIPAWGVRVLIDAGARPSVPRPGVSKFPDYRTLERPDLVLLTHGHFDHIAALPLVVRRFPDVPVYSTPPTRDIVDVNLADAVRVDEMLRDEGTLIEEAPYTAEEARVAAAGILELPFYATHQRVVGDVVVAVTPIPAGHTLGAASFQLRFTHRTDGEIRWLAMGDYAGDVTLVVDPLDVEAHLKFQPHGVVSESTYGTDTFNKIEAEREQLRRALVAVRRRGGTTIIPVFALGRAQEVAALCWEWFDAWERWCRVQSRDPGAAIAEDDAAIWAAVEAQPMLPHTAVVIDGLAKHITRIHERHPEALAGRLRERYQRTGEIITSRHYKILLNDGRPMMHAGRAIREGRAPEPAIILAPSGMLVGGRVVKWLHLLGNDPRNALLFSGYLDCESPGGKLLALAQTGDAVPGRTIDIGNETVPVALPIRQYRLRAHIDGPSVVRVMTLVRPQHIVLAHGREGAAADLAALLAQAVPTAQVHIPANLECLAVEVAPDPVDAERVGPTRNASGQGVDRLMHGVEPATVYLAMRAGTNTTHDPRDLAYRILGVPHTAAERRTSIRLVTETLETFENLLFRRRADDATTRWTTVQASRMTGWFLDRDVTAAAEDGLWSSVPTDPSPPGLALVRYLVHYPRLAFLGPADARGEHPAIVALGRHGQVHPRDVLLPIRMAELAAQEWSTSLGWARMMRRGITTLQLEAERLLDGDDAEAILRRAALAGEAAAAFRARWADVAAQRGRLAPLSPGAAALLDRLREVVIATGERRVIGVSARALRRLLRQDEDVMRTSNPYEAVRYPKLRELTSVVNEVRQVLGMPAVATTPAVIFRYPFDVTAIVQDAAAVGSSGPALGEVTLSLTEQVAIALHHARILCDPFILAGAGDSVA